MQRTLEARLAHLEAAKAARAPVGGDVIPYIKQILCDLPEAERNHVYDVHAAEGLEASHDLLMRYGHEFAPRAFNAIVAILRQRKEAAHARSHR